MYRTGIVPCQARAWPTFVIDFRVIGSRPPVSSHQSAVCSPSCDCRLSVRTFPHRLEVENISNRPLPLRLRLPHRAHRQPHAHLPPDLSDRTAAYAAHKMEESDPLAGAIDLNHRRNLRGTQRLPGPGHVADGEGVDRAGVEQLDPFIHRFEVEFTERAGWGDGATASPAAYAVDLALPQPVQKSADGDPCVPRILQSWCPRSRAHLPAELFFVERVAPQRDIWRRLRPRDRGLGSRSRHHRTPRTATVPTCITSPQACATPRSGFPGTCRAPASRRSCQNNSQTFINPAAAIGLPPPINPPEGP